MKEFDEIFAEIEAQTPQNKVANLFDDIKKDSSRQLILYGAGGNCEYAMFTCSLVSASVTCVCDSKATGAYEYKKNLYDIISPTQLVKNYPNSFVLITTWKHEREIRNSLLELGFPGEQVYYLRYPFLLTAEAFREKYLAGYRWAYNFFTDDNSKRKIVDRIKLHLWGVPVQPNSLYADGYFMHPNIVLNGHEVYIDGGAYIGDSAEEFIKQVGNSGYAHIYSFEPDLENYKSAVSNLAGYNSIDVIPYGLWSKEDELEFIMTGSEAEHIDSGLATVHLQSGTNIVKVTSLDAFFEGKPTHELPTLIKMDIEGAEREALIGSAEVLKKVKPKMAICAYHKPEDIYELPQTIMNIRKDYKLSLWQIGESFWDLVLYAV